MPQLVKADQRSPEWFAARLGKPSGSKYGDIVARTKSGYSASRKNYVAELAVERLTGRSTEVFVTSAMQWGTDNEPVARLNYELVTGRHAEETGFWLHDELETGASPDGLIDDDGLLEIKCPNTATHIDTLFRNKLPYQYQAQVQGQMWITGRKWCDFVSFDPRLPENAQMIVMRVERDDVYIADLEIEIKNFLEEVETQVEFIKNYK